MDCAPNKTFHRQILPLCGDSVGAITQRLSLCENDLEVVSLKGSHVCTVDIKLVSNGKNIVYPCITYYSIF